MNAITFPCPFCDERFGSRRTLQRHKPKAHPKMAKDFAHARLVPQFPCRHCGKPYGSKKACYNHASKCPQKGLFGATKPKKTPLPNSQDA